MKLMSWNRLQASYFPYKNRGFSGCQYQSPPWFCSSGNMKVSVAALAVLLIAAVFSLASSAPIGPDTSVCCFVYGSRQFPKGHLKDYFYTSGKCSQPAVVFITRKDRQICADPDTKWVKEYVNYLEMK
ncbi:LOW QUALITY PROTEIN: C-C motif chemokine 5-like [Emydura macquarii macquarii]|uniref:LOW QUALITY PROTEIN: C-C motif chemokine 5-like n=1 Tax=Emydura macquarii macquarii TaxID=1129001 RepID=UPI00352A93F5